MIRTLDFRVFSEDDFETYQHWFDDPAVSRPLGAIDQEWLDYVLTDKTGVEYAVYEAQILIAVVGIVLPGKETQAYVISNFAVNPAYTSMGIGSRVLKELLVKYPLDGALNWWAFVETWNVHAQRFFEKNGWAKMDSRENDMIKYTVT